MISGFFNVFEKHIFVIFCLFVAFVAKSAHHLCRLGGRDLIKINWPVSLISDIEMVVKQFDALPMQHLTKTSVHWAIRNLQNMQKPL